MEITREKGPNEKVFNSSGTERVFCVGESEESEMKVINYCQVDVGRRSPDVVEDDHLLVGLSPLERKTFFIAREIYLSERSFVDVLDLLTTDFESFVETVIKHYAEELFLKKYIETFMGNLSSLKKLNEFLLAKLEERISNWKEARKIADIFVAVGPYFKLYVTYMKDFRRNCSNFESLCEENKVFARAVKDFELSERCKKLTLRHFMLKPVQRIPQYKLLLTAYLKSLDQETSIDYEDSVKAIFVFSDVAAHANNALRFQANTRQMLSLQHRIYNGAIIIKPGRYLIKLGELLKACRRELQPRLFALMNDCLLCFSYHVSIPYRKDLQLQYEIPLDGMCVMFSQWDNSPRCFSVISGVRSFSLFSKSITERENWVKALNNAIYQNTVKSRWAKQSLECEFRLGYHAPLFVQVTQVTMCQLCTIKFSPIQRRQLCKACGKVVCGKCSSGRAPLQYRNNNMARVCDVCLRLLQNENGNINQIHPTFQLDKVKKNVFNCGVKCDRNTPSCLEIPANTPGYITRGYLFWRENKQQSWKRRWFTLFDRVLYVYKAPEDVVAYKSLPVLGWVVTMEKSDAKNGSKIFFRLSHSGLTPILFRASKPTIAQRWVISINESTHL